MSQIISADDFAAIMATDPERARELIERFRRTIVVPHEGGQVEVLQSTARFQIACCGRRWGKTKIAGKKALAFCRQPEKVVWWIAPNYKNTRRGYREILKQIPPGVLERPAPVATSNELILHFAGGTRMEFYSAENPDSLAGEGVHFVVVDEAALIRGSVWNQLIRPTLMDTQGSAFLISTPRGFNYFYQMWKQGQDGVEGFESWHHPTIDNPYVPDSEIEEARRTMPLAVFEQEVLAQFISDAANVFRGLPEAVRGMAQLGPGDHVALGIDLAKRHDFTVLSGSRMSDRLPVYHDRFNAVSWPEQRRRIHDAVAAIEATGAIVTVAIDSTGVGDVIYDDLELEGLDVIGIKFTNQWKQMAVMLLSADIERGDAFLLEGQLEEFSGYSYELTSAGRMVYSGPEGGFDDEVSAKLLEHWVQVHYGAPNVRVLDMQPVVGAGMTHALQLLGMGEDRDESEISDDEEIVDAVVVPDSWNESLWS